MATRSKYSAIRTRLKGQTFDSRLEARRWLYLQDRQRRGHISNLRRQVRYQLLPGEKLPDGSTLRPVTYVADFVYDHPDGHQTVEDAKGVRTQVYKLKRHLMWHIHQIIIHETESPTDELR